MENENDIQYHNLLKSDEFVEDEIRCILEGKYNPNIITIGEEMVVLINIYNELEEELDE